MNHLASFKKAYIVPIKRRNSNKKKCVLKVTGINFQNKWHSLVSDGNEFNGDVLQEIE